MRVNDREYTVIRPLPEGKTGLSWIVILWRSDHPRGADQAPETELSSAGEGRYTDPGPGGCGLCTEPDPEGIHRRRQCLRTGPEAGSG